MKRLRRSERLVFITKYLLERPLETVGLSFFVQELGAAKSSISEDLSLIKGALAKLDVGQIETELGAAGGVRYLPRVKAQVALDLAHELAGRLTKEDRIIPGGFLYLTDLVFSPQVVARVGEVFASYFQRVNPNYVITVETKGIPMATMTAHYLGVPLLIARREQRVTEGSAVSITYVSGSTQRVQTMSLARRSLPPGARVVAIDDFMKAGGTARGLQELLLEFSAELVGTGVLMETATPVEKLVDNYVSLLVLEEVEPENHDVKVTPSAWLLEGVNG